MDAIVAPASKMAMDICQIPAPDETSSPRSLPFETTGDDLGTSRIAPVGRLVNKDGSRNLIGSHISKRRLRLLSDTMTSFADASFPFNLLISTAAFVSSWMLFGLFWWIIAIRQDGDGGSADGSVSNRTGTRTCLYEVPDLVNALIFSVESQTTIGYGSRVMNPHCTETLVLIMAQLVVGVFVEALATGFLVQRFSHVTGRRLALRFSRNAVICERSGRACLLFRVGNLRRSQLIGATIRASLVRFSPAPDSTHQRELSEEGGGYGHGLICTRSDMTLETEMGIKSRFVLPGWPVEVAHPIDSSSPLWRLSEDQLQRDNFEVIVTIDGTQESTGSNTRFVTSYLASEIQWGHQLACLTFRETSRSGSGWSIDCSEFDASVPIPSFFQCSVEEWTEKRNNKTDATSAWRPDSRQALESV